jgi:hypothetical protein
MTTVGHDRVPNGEPRRRPVHRWAVGVTVLFALSACGVTAPPSRPAPGQAATPPTTLGQTTPNAADAKDAFIAYYRALQDRDFAAACALNAPETTETLIANVRGSGIDTSSCVDAFTQIYNLPAAATQADEIARSATVEDVAVKGDIATITWSGRVSGKATTTTSKMRLLDGLWRVLDTSS